MKIIVTGGSGFIGTNLMEQLLVKGKYTLLNLDIDTPKKPQHITHWRKCDILNSDDVNSIVHAFNPDVIIHLAARTDTDPKNKIEDYEVNIKGSSVILDAIKHSNVKLAIFTSTQFVHQYQGFPKNDEDFAPHTVYGESKVMMEKMIRNANLNCAWTIIRPTNIWGPWHLRYPHEFWKVLSKGLYIHAGRKPVVRSYGYVGNVVFQIISILESQLQKVDRKVFYVGDMPIDIYYWVNGFSVRQTGKNVTIVPRIVIRAIAFVGDVLAFAGIKFPITSSRYKSMTTGNTAPMEQTFEAFGNPPYTLEAGIDETIEWMKQEFPDLVKKKIGAR